MRKELISSTQVFALATIFLLGSWIILTPSSRITKQDAWIGSLLLGLPACGYALLLSAVKDLYPGENLIGLSRKAFGQRIGSILAVFWLWFPLHLAALVLNNLTSLLMYQIYPTASAITLSLPLIIVIAYSAALGPEVIARFALILLPLIIAGLLAIYGLAIPLFDAHHLFPLLEASTGDFLRQGLAGFSFPFAEMILLFPFLAHAPKDRSLLRPLLSAVILSTLLFALRDMIAIAVFGQAEVDTLLFPLFSVVLHEELGIFLDRLDVAFIPVFFFSSLIKGMICFYSFIEHLTDWLGAKERSLLIPPAALLTVGLSLFVYEHLLDVFDFANKAYALYLLPWALGFPLGALILRYRKKVKPSQS
ncbi:spore germination protein, putative [Heliomicrobium modesticaldum Ice1]|uniref:Spore germination protein, putative n=1 Tax=Heliobacterium modesticaldum (strain ATCC 51547 / Ice1) TaxID=498761 RepID=B0TFJ4_HELMI|nr:spore germination protein, putative [Heliomicrobium modesticaldum Ice1]